MKVIKEGREGQRGISLKEGKEARKNMSKNKKKHAKKLTYTPLFRL